MPSWIHGRIIRCLFRGIPCRFFEKIITSVELTGPLKFTKDIGNLHYDVPFIRLNEKPGLGIEINEDTLRELTVFQGSVR